ncbi:MAG TPA: hypothetical protein VKB79_19255 [Bryobacteraceae bacterium]|nr:hypothetical protein [Bryobacteraceae bacterium]
MRRLAIVLTAATVYAAQEPGFKTRPANPTPPTQTAGAIHDLSRMLPSKGLKHSGIVMDQVFGISKLPGGTVGDYESGGKKYRIFIIDARANQDAAFMLLDAKSALKNPEYLASFGGYFGQNGTEPVFVFAKQRYLAGIGGLPKDQADPLARTLASKLQ